MAQVKYLSLEGLASYDNLIKTYISDNDAKSIKTVTISGNVVKFYKAETVTEETVADFSITLPDGDVSNLLEKITGGVVGNVVTIGADGTVIDSGIAADDLATKEELETVSNKVGDISTLTTTEKTNVVGAVNEVKASVGTLETNSKVTIDTSITTEGALKSYTINQGGVKISTIDIPKDLVVTSGSVVVDPEGQPEGTYIKLVIANQEEPVFINVVDLIEDYNGSADATQVQISVDNLTRTISATIVAGSVGTTELADTSVTTAKIADANVTLAKLADDVTSAFDSKGSAAQALEDAKSYADGLNTSITEDEINSLFS